ncbi:MAG: hypothetical protein E7K04_03110 [Helicobacter sp.]|nr:hypothetical protein [Helicobacter sp.]
MRSLLIFAVLFMLAKADIGRHSGFVGGGGGLGDFIVQNTNTDTSDLRHEFSIIWGLEGGYQYKILPFLATRLYLESKMTLIALNLAAIQTQFSINSDLIFRLLQVKNDRSFSILLGLGFGVVQDLSEAIDKDKSILDINLKDFINSDISSLSKYRPIGYTNVGAIFQLNESGEIKALIKSPLDLQNSKSIIVNFTASYIHHF